MAEQVRARVDEVVATPGERDPAEHERLRALLDAVPADDRGGVWRRSSLLADLAFRQRRRKAFGQLRRMRARLAPEDFDALWAECRRVLAPYTLGPHGYLIALGERDPQEVWGEVTAVLDALRGLGREAFVVSGTLLGLVRGGGLLAHDDDVDLAVVLGSSAVTDVAAEWVDLKARLGADGLLDPAFDNDGKHHCRVRVHGGVDIDLFPAWLDGDRVFVWPHTHGDLDRNDLLPLAHREVGGATVTTPRDAERMLALNYGPDWRVPDPTFRFDWQRAKARFADFVALLPSAGADYSS